MAIAYGEFIRDFIVVVFLFDSLEFGLQLTIQCLKSPGETVGV